MHHQTSGISPPCISPPCIRPGEAMLLPPTNFHRHTPLESRSSSLPRSPCWRSWRLLGMPQVDPVCSEGRERRLQRGLRAVQRRPAAAWPAPPAGPCRLRRRQSWPLQLTHEGRRSLPTASSLEHRRHGLAEWGAG